MIKRKNTTLSKVGIEWNFLNMIKGIHQNPTANIILKTVKSWNLSPKIKNKTRIPNFTMATAVDIALEVLDRAVLQDKPFKLERKK